jgi:hypothetical protein
LELSKSKHGDLWEAAMSLELGKLTKGNVTTTLTGTDTMRFISIREIPAQQKITCTKIVCADRPERTPPIRVRVTIGENLITYDGATSTKAAELPTSKIFANSVISTPGCKFMTVDVKNFYLNTARMPEKDFAYMKMPMNVIPDDIKTHYKLNKLEHNGAIYIEVSKGIYCLPQVGKLANEQLIRHLQPFRYAPCKHIPGLWKHATRNIQFLLVVDDFGVKYTNVADARHLISALETAYQVTTDWTGEKYCGLKLKWNYGKRTIEMSMPGYVERALQCFQHVIRRRQGNPYKFITPEFGAKVQYAPSEDMSPLLDAAGKKYVQEVLGTLLYLGRAVDPTICSLSTQQANPTESKIKSNSSLTQLLWYSSKSYNTISRQRHDTSCRK